MSTPTHRSITSPTRNSQMLEAVEHVPQHEAMGDADLADPHRPLAGYRLPPDPVKRDEIAKEPAGIPPRPLPPGQQEIGMPVDDIGIDVVMPPTGGKRGGHRLMQRTSQHIDHRAHRVGLLAHDGQIGLNTHPR